MKVGLFREKNIRYLTALDLIKCLTQIMADIAPCARIISALPFNIGTKLQQEKLKDDTEKTICLLFDQSTYLYMLYWSVYMYY